MAGASRYSALMAGFTGWLVCGMTNGAVRWNTVRCSTSGWMDGTIWIADAPVPTTATRRPAARQL